MSNYTLGEARGRIVLETDFKGLVEAQKELDKLKNNNKDSAKSFDGVNKAVNNVANTSLAAGAAVALGFGAAVKTAADFEFQMSAIQAVSGATADEMDLINQAALRIGKDTAFGAVEAGQAMEELVKAGISVEDTLGGAADAVVALAAAGGVDLPTAATIASNAMNQFGLAAEDLVGVTDTIAGAANASAIDMEQFAYSMSQVGAVAKLAGLSFDDTAVAIAEMGNAGIVGSDAGTSLKTMLMNLQPSTEKQVKAMRELGLVTEDGTNQFYDQEGRLKSLRDIQDILGKSLEGLTQQQKQVALETIFGSDAIRGAAVLAGEGAAGYDKMTAAIGKVSAAEVAETRLKNLNGSIEQLKGGVETVAIQIGQLLIPVLTKLVDGVSGVLDGVIAMSDGQRQAAAILVGSVGAFLLVFGVVVKLTYGFLEFRNAILLANGATTLFGNSGALASIKVALGQLIAGLTGTTVAAGVTTGSLYAFGAAARGAAAAAFLFAKGLLANPIIRIVAIILAIVGALVALTGGWEEVGKIFKPLGEAMVAAFKNIANALKPAMELFKQAGKELGDKLAPAFRELGQKLIPPLVSILTALVDILIPIVDAVAAVAVPLLSALAPALVAVATVVGVLLDALMPVIDVLLKILVPILENVGTVLGWLADLITWWTGLVGDAFGNKLPKIIEVFGPKFKALYDKYIKPFVDDFIAAWESLKAKVEPVVTWINETAIPAIKDGFQKTKEKVNELKDDFVKAWDEIKARVEPVVSYLVDTAIPLIMGSFNALKLGAEAIAKNVGLAWEAIKTVVGPVVDWYKTQVADAMEKRAETLKGAYDKVRDAIAGAWEYIKSKVGPVIEFLGNAQDILGSKFDTVKDKVENLKAKFVEAWERIKAAVQPIADTLRNEVLPRLADALESVRSKMDEVKDKFAEAWEQIESKVKPIIDRLMPVIQNLKKKFDEMTGQDGGGKGLGGAKKGGEEAKTGIDPLMLVLNTLLLIVLTVVNVFIIFIDTITLVVAAFSLMIATATTVGSIVGTVFSGMFTTVSGIFTDLAATVGRTWENIKNVISTAVQIVMAVITGNWSALPALVGQLFGQVGATISGIWEGIKTTVRNAVQNVKDTAQNVFSQLPPGIQGALRNLASTITSPFQDALAFIRGVPGMILGVFGGLGGLLVGAGRSLISGLISGIDSMIGTLRARLAEITALIPQVKGPPEKDKILLEPAGKSIMQSLINGIQSRTGDLSDLLGGLNVSIPADVQQNVYSSVGTARPATASGPTQIDRSVHLNVTTDENPTLWARAAGREFQDSDTGAGR